MNKIKSDVLHIGLLKNFFELRLNRWIILSSILVLLGVYFYFSNYHKEILFPGGKNINYDFYNDRGNGGNSVILSNSISDTTINMEFKLKEGFVSPYVGVSLRNKLDSVFNLSTYNRLCLEIAGEQLRSIGLSLFASNIYSKSKKEVCFYENIDIDHQRKKYILDLDELKVPEWWYGTNNIRVEEKLKPDLSNIYAINIGTTYVTASDINRSMRIYSISFERDNSRLIVYLVLAELLIIMLLVGAHYIKGYKALPVTITYKAVDIENENRQANSFIYYINNNFHDHNLTLQQVSDQTGINQRRITHSIQQSFGCNFKTYVNKLRINESKRLLIESDLNMGEIAFKVGFSNQTHFNRVFKSIEGINPSEFLENKKK